MNEKKFIRYIAIVEKQKFILHSPVQKKEKKNCDTIHLPIMPHMFTEELESLEFKIFCFFFLEQKVRVQLHLLIQPFF